MIKRKVSGGKAILVFSVGLVAAGAAGALVATGVHSALADDEGVKKTATATKYWVSGDSESGAADGLVIKVG